MDFREERSAGARRRGREGGEARGVLDFREERSAGRWRPAAGLTDDGSTWTGIKSFGW